MRLAVNLGDGQWTYLCLESTYPKFPTANRRWMYIHPARYAELKQRFMAQQRFSILLPTVGLGMSFMNSTIVPAQMVPYDTVIHTDYWDPDIDYDEFTEWVKEVRQNVHRRD